MARNKDDKSLVLALGTGHRTEFRRGVISAVRGC
jgi:hypothetical protein